MAHKKQLLILLFLIFNMACSSLNKVVKKKEIVDLSNNYEASDYKVDTLFLKSSAAMLSRDYASANKYFSELIKVRPNNLFVKRRYAISLIKAGKVSESKTLLQQVFNDSKHKDVEAGLILAGVMTSTGETKEARGIYKKVLAKDRKNQDACVFLGKSYALDKQTKKAVSVLSKCSALAKNKGIFDYFIGKIYIEKQNLNKALSYFKKSLRKEPSYGQAALGVGLVYEEQKKSSKALATYKKFLSKYEDKSILERIVSLYFAKEKYETVIPYAERLSDLDLSNLNLKVKLGILYTDTKKYEKAIGIFKSLVSVSPKNDKLLYYLGAIYQEIEEFEKAINYYSLIDTDSGLYSDSSLQVAQMLMSDATKDSSGEDKFVSYIQKKVTQLPELSTELRVIEANYFNGKGLYKQALKSLEEVKSNDDFNINHKFFIAAVYEKVESFEKAYSVMNDILKEDNNNAHALNFVGYSLVERELELDKAYVYIKKALSLRPEDGYIRDSLGWYYFKVGKTSKALKELTQASKQVKKDPSIQKHLAVVYSKLKQFEMAKKFLRNAIKYTESESKKELMRKALDDLEVNRFPASLK